MSAKSSPRGRGNTWPSSTPIPASTAVTRPRPTCSAIPAHPAFRAPDGPHAGAPRPYPPPARRRAQHRGAPRPPRLARSPSPPTSQIHCAEELGPLGTSILAWLERRGGSLDDYAFPSLIDNTLYISTRQ